MEFIRFVKCVFELSWNVTNFGFILIGFTQIYFSTAYESSSLCMYHAMTFYESFGLEVAYKIIKRKLASRVYIFTNLTQVWSGDETIKYNDQIFMIIDGNVPYLDWASSYISIYDTANETITPEMTPLSDTNEAFTFRENFIDKKYGTHTPNETTFSDLNLELTTSSSLPTTRRQNINDTHRNSYDRITKGDRFPPNVTFPDLETEEDNAIRESYNKAVRNTDNAFDEKEETSIRENQRLIKEQRAREARRNFRRREEAYDERNLARIYPRMRQQRYAQQKAPEMYDRIPPRYYEQQNAPDWYDGDTPRNYEENEPDWIENNLPRYFERGNARESYERDEPENAVPNAQDWAYEDRVRQTTNVMRNIYRNGRRPVWSKSARTSRSRGIMDIIKNFINPFSSNEVTIANRVKGAHANNKVRRKTRARKVNENYQPYKVIHDTDNVENFRNYEHNNPVNHHYIFMQPGGNQNINYGQKQRNERRTMRSKRSRVRKNERQVARARQNIQSVKGRANGMGNSYYLHRMNYAGENVQGNMKYYYAPSAANTYHHEHIVDNHKPINIHDNEGINNYHAPGIHRPQVENNFAHFHQINEAADHLNELTRLHKIAKERIPPPNHNILHDHQSNLIHDNPMRGNINSPRFSDHDRHHIHEVQHVIRPQNEQYQSYRARPVYNPNNLPVLHETANKQPYHMIHHPNSEVMHLQINPRSRVRSHPKSKQFRKVKSAPRVGKGRAKPRAAKARKSKMATVFYQYNNAPDTGAHTTIHFIDVVQYHYEPRQDMRMIQ